MKPLVSILIPCYNSAPWLAATLESALEQTWENIEVLLVDDGSTDDSLEIAKKFEPCGVKVISQNNRGASAARNRALQEAQGDFIQYLDADDLLAPDKIERQVQLLNSDRNSNYIASGAWARFYKTPSEALFIPQPLWVDMSPVDWLICAWEGHWMMHPAAWLVPRKIADKAGFWSENLSLNDDGEYFVRILLSSQEVKFCKGAKSYYRSGNSNSLSGSKSRKAWESAFLALELSSNNLLLKDDSPRTRHACATVFQRFLYEVYPHVPYLQQKAEAKAKELGGSDLEPSGGLIFKLLSSFLGWKRAKYIQGFAYQYGYISLALGWKLSRLKENKFLIDPSENS
ncbi:glycosyltransferase family 2 protein [Tolypothrix sp. FACHB-123]|uniref:glycosyltransferase family 2 protein n=1 Tax=Tolypothrix sp. FACHB-123 TaxID=2692868 RepID=UPI0016837947|nr:glycosyltransferase family 2 protein [Tolypothrix sp. FACHB-123]MBD2357541.1 glycosyltransferase family 2 protein [Tolypothrix sp. FACHB-123]